MDSTRKDAIDAVRREEAAVSRTVKVLKATATILACIGIYSSSAYAQEGSFASVIGPITDVKLISPTDGQVFPITSMDMTATVPPMHVTGKWEYDWANSTGTEKPINLEAAFVVKDSNGSNVVNIFKTIDTALVPSNPADTASNPHHGGPRMFDATVPVGALDIGSYTASVSVQGSELLSLSTFLPELW